MNDTTEMAVKAETIGLADEIIDEIGELAQMLETAGRRLGQWCDEQPPNYLVIPELARGVAISAADVATRLEDEAGKLQLRCRLGDDPVHELRWRDDQSTTDAAVTGESRK
jgi:hypothetical protein